MLIILTLSTNRQHTSKASKGAPKKNTHLRGKGVHIFLETCHHLSGGEAAYGHVYAYGIFFCNFETCIFNCSDRPDSPNPKIFCQGFWSQTTFLINTQKCKATIAYAYVGMVFPPRFYGGLEGQELQLCPQHWTESLPGKLLVLLFNAKPTTAGISKTYKIYIYNLMQPFFSSWAAGNFLEENCFHCH